MHENYRQSLESADLPRRIYPFSQKSGKFLLWKGRRLINLASNNYLGWGDNPELSQRFFEEYPDALRLSFSSGSSRLLTGTGPEYDNLESLLAGRLEQESALLFNSGYQANLGTIGALLDRDDVFFADRLVHASMIDGLKLSPARFFRFAHNDSQHLEYLLKKERSKYRNAWILTESIFSMEGDISPLNEIIDLKNRFDCSLMLDEAHAFGVLGKQGLGLAERENCLSEVDLILGTFGKAIGSVGAFVAGSNVLIQFLINRARSFIFSTALPEINVAFTRWILENKLPQPEREILCKQMFNRAEKLRNGFIQRGWQSGGETQIIPLIAGNDSALSSLSERLFQAGFCVLPIRSPTVAKGKERFRFSLSTDITDEEIDRILEAIDEKLV